MGVRGPVPQRSEQTVRRNTPETPIEKVAAIGTTPIPALDIKNAHPLVVDLYEAMQNSAQAKFYEPSDWAYARVTFHFVNKLLKSPKPSAMMLSSVNSMLTSLLLTEGDRRRVRIEVERNPTGATVTNIADVYRAKLGQ